MQKINLCPLEIQIEMVKLINSINLSSQTKRNNDKRIFEPTWEIRFGLLREENMISWQYVASCLHTIGSKCRLIKYESPAPQTVNFTNEMGRIAVQRKFKDFVLPEQNKYCQAGFMTKVVIINVHAYYTKTVYSVIKLYSTVNQLISHKYFHPFVR